MCVCRREERELIASSGSKFRQFSFNLVESQWFSFSILAVIMLNPLFIAIQTSKYVVAKAGEGLLCAHTHTHTHTETETVVVEKIAVIYIAIEQAAYIYTRYYTGKNRI